MEDFSARFFRRFTEGVLVIEDRMVRRLKPGTFCSRFSPDKGSSPGSWIAGGYPNGATIVRGLFLICRELVCGAIVLRPLFVTDQGPPAGFSGREILILSEAGDPLGPFDDAKTIAPQFGSKVAMDKLTMPLYRNSLLKLNPDTAREWLGPFSVGSANTRL